MNPPFDLHHSQLTMQRVMTKFVRFVVSLEFSVGKASKLGHCEWCELRNKR